MHLLAQTTELVDQGQTFAERFGWEALVIVAGIAFLGAMVWRVGGRVAGSVANFLEASLTQLRSQVESQAKLSEAIALLSATATAVADASQRIDRHTADTNEKVDKLVTALLAAARIAYDSIPDDAKEAREKLLRVIRDLEK